MDRGRRNFLKRAGLAIAAFGIDPELLVWQPRQQVAVPAMPSLMGVDYGVGDAHSVWMLVWSEDVVRGIFPKGSKPGKIERKAIARSWDDIKAIVDRTGGELVMAQRMTYVGDGARDREVRFERFFARRAF